jgi:hypothetical protein
LTKTAAIFGPNASGKSNLLLALRTMRDLAVHSACYSDAKFAEAYTPFRWDGADRQPTVFGIDLLLLDVLYHYTFSYDAQRITAESLHVHQSRKPQRWFGRSCDESGAESWTPFSPSLNGPREKWRKATHSRALFLTIAGRQNAEHMRHVLRWFERDLAIVLSSDDAGPNAFAVRVRDPQFKARVLGIFHAVDIQIDDVRTTDATTPPQDPASAPSIHNLPVRLPRNSTIEFLHRRQGGLSVWLDFAHEAAGIQRLVNILGPLLDAIENGTFIAIDEIDTSLHSLVARFLIRLINNPVVSRRCAQLLINSHNTKLMDLDILRRDEIWLMELNKDHASLLSALFQQSPRKHERVGKNYLHGYFGAVPVISPYKWRDVEVPYPPATQAHESSAEGVTESGHFGRAFLHDDAGFGCVQS